MEGCMAFKQDKYGPEGILIANIVDKLNGSIGFSSSSGGKNHGAAIEITIPLTPTMFRAITWRWGPYYYAIPLFVIDKIVLSTFVLLTYNIISFFKKVQKKITGR